MALSRLIIAVSEIDSATSPRANDVRILEVTPPGAAAMIMTPIASSGVRGQTLTSRKATTGNQHDLRQGADDEIARFRHHTGKIVESQSQAECKHDERQRNRQNDVGHESHSILSLL